MRNSTAEIFRSLTLNRIDRSLNYGRDHIRHYLNNAGPYSAVLDLGAGSGNDLIMAKEIQPGTELYAADYHKENIEQLKQKGFSAIRIDIETSKLPYEDESMDVIICNQILEHVKEIFWIFHEVTRVLKPGGRFIIGVPNLASLHNRALLLFGQQPTSIQNNSAHLRGYTKNDVVKFIESSFPDGYKLVDFKGSNFYPFPPIIAKTLASIFPTMAWGIFFNFEKTRKYSKQFLEYPSTQKLETNFYTGT